MSIPGHNPTNRAKKHVIQPTPIKCTPLKIGAGGSSKIFKDPPFSLKFFKDSPLFLGRNYQPPLKKYVLTQFKTSLYDIYGLVFLRCKGGDF